MGSEQEGKAMEEVKLHGMWASPFSKRVEWALKLKGIPYEYVEEDFEKKSEDLLKCNPVYKKVPVLVHNGRPVAESLVILEYIDETWKEEQLLPADPFIRSRIRFWAHFYDNTVMQTSRPLLWSEGEAQEKAIKDHMENLKVLEEGLNKDFSGGTPYLHGEKPGYLDIVLGSMFGSHQATEEAIGAQLVDPEMNPTILKWLDAIKSHPVVKETLPPHDQMVALLRHAREMVLSSSKA